ncbi:hypothetical protein [Bacillus pumilus]|nr:hypothetical protein [Bacillus pumilus]
MVFSYFAYVTGEKKERKMSGHKKTRGQMASRFTYLFGVII